MSCTWQTVASFQQLPSPAWTPPPAVELLPQAAACQTLYRLLNNMSMSHSWIQVHTNSHLDQTELGHQYDTADWTVKIYHSLQYIQQLFPLITQSYIATKFYAWSCVTCNKHTKFELDQVEAYRKMWLEVSTFWCSFDLETRLRSLKMVGGGGGGY